MAMLILSRSGRRSRPSAQPAPPHRPRHARPDPAGRAGCGPAPTAPRRRTPLERLAARCSYGSVEPVRRRSHRFPSTRSVIGESGEQVSSGRGDPPPSSPSMRSAARVAGAWHVDIAGQWREPPAEVVAELHLTAPPTFTSTGTLNAATLNAAVERAAARTAACHADNPILSCRTAATPHSNTCSNIHGAGPRWGKHPGSATAQPLPRRDLPPPTARETCTCPTPTSPP